MWLWKKVDFNREEDVIKIYEFIGSKIKEHRKKLGVSQDQVSKEMGFSRENISRHENGRVSITVDKLYKIAEILKINAKELLP